MEQNKVISEDDVSIHFSNYIQSTQINFGQQHVISLENLQQQMIQQQQQEKEKIVINSDIMQLNSLKSAPVQNQLPNDDETKLIEVLPVQQPKQSQLIISKGDQQLFIVTDEVIFKKQNPHEQYQNRVILINEEQIEDFHAIIKKYNNKFFLIDLDSRFGSYIEIKVQALKVGDIMKCGSTTIQVLKIQKKSDQELEFQLFCRGPNKNYFINQTLKNKDILEFGRKFPAIIQDFDQEMSGFHAQLQAINDTLIIEDKKSSNGTWLKVTAPYEFIEAKCIKFGRGTIFKVII